MAAEITPDLIKSVVRQEQQTIEAVAMDIMNKAFAEPRVYVTNLAGHDYTKAEKYGKIVPITHGYVSFQSLDRVKFQITEEVRKSRKEDWLLLSGTPLLSVIAAVAWFAIHDCVNLLVYDHKDNGKYRELRISQKNMNDMLAVLGDSDGA